MFIKWRTYSNRGSVAGLGIGYLSIYTVETLFRMRSVGGLGIGYQYIYRLGDLFRIRVSSRVRYRLSVYL